MPNKTNNPAQPSGDALKPSSGVSHRTPEGYVGMFDVAETISRLCNEGTLDLGLKNISPVGPAIGEKLPEPVSQGDTSTATGRGLVPLDLLSKSFLQNVVNHLADRSGKSVGLILASKSGRVVQSVHCGWDAGRVRMQQRTVSKLARELTIIPVARYSADSTKIDTQTETTHCGSVFLNELAQAVGTPLYLVPIALPGSSGLALVYCEVPQSEPSTDTDFAESVQSLWCNPTSLNSLTQQLDAWLMVQRCDWTLRAIRTVDWIRSRPRWWLAPLAVLGAGLFAPVPYYPRRECIFEPESKQFLASPIAGRIMSCEVRPGDAVESDQLLARLDDDQLQRDLATAKAEYDGALKKRDSALATRAAGNAGLADIEMKQAQWRIESIQDHLRRLEIRAKAPGVVVQGDWHRSVGMPVTLGQSLFEVAELESMVAEVRLKATDLGQINVGDSVSVRSDASGLATFHGKISRIEPRATVVDNSAVFVADVVIRDPSLKLRPGMKATAQIAAGWRTVGSLLFERPFHWIANQWIW